MSLYLPRFLRPAGLALCVIVTGLAAYTASGWWDAVQNAPAYKARAQGLIAAGKGADALGPRWRWLLRVEDPGFDTHPGVDFTTPGAGKTTLTQSLSKRLAFDNFRPGLRKLRQTGHALGLERRLTKAEIAALWLETVPMGRGPDGWMDGFFTASEAVYGKPPADLADSEFLFLVAVLIAPGRFDLTAPDAALIQRNGRIAALIAGDCAPMSHSDVWLDGCR